MAITDANLIDQNCKKEAIQHAKEVILNQVGVCICPTIMNYLEEKTGQEVPYKLLAYLFPTITAFYPIRAKEGEDPLTIPFYPLDEYGQQKRLQLLERIEQNDL